jgi:hypothetical protein
MTLISVSGMLRKIVEPPDVLANIIDFDKREIKPEAKKLQAGISTLFDDSKKFYNNVQAISDLMNAPSSANDPRIAQLLAQESQAAFNVAARHNAVNQAQNRLDVTNLKIEIAKKDLNDSCGQYVLAEKNLQSVVLVTQQFLRFASVELDNYFKLVFFAARAHK